MKRTLLLLFFSFVLHFNYAQKKDSLSNNNYEFGIHAGLTTGFGLSFRYWEDGYGIQLTALPFKRQNDWTGVKDQWFSAGLTVLYTFRESKYYRFFAYLGGHLLYGNRDEYDHFGMKKNDKYNYNMGLGPGIELGKNLRFNFMTGVGAYNLTGRIFILPAAEIGLYLNFN